MQKAQEAFQRENVHFSSTGSTKVNKNRFGSSPSPTQSTKQTRNTLFTNKKAEAKPGIPKKEIPGVGVSPKRQSRNTSAGKPAGGGFRQNENPFKRSPDHSIGHFHMTAEPSDFQSRFGEVISMSHSQEKRIAMANKSGMDYAYDFARNAQALKDIIKAAMRGGWHAAAIEVIKHYGPQILMAAVVILLLPVIIFLLSSGNAFRFWQLCRP